MVLKIGGLLLCVCCFSTRVEAAPNPPTKTHPVITSTTNSVEIVPRFQQWATVVVEVASPQSVTLGLFLATTTCPQGITAGDPFGITYPAGTGRNFLRVEIDSGKKICAILPSAGTGELEVEYQ